MPHNRSKKLNNTFHFFPIILQFSKNEWPITAQLNEYLKKNDTMEKKLKSLLAKELSPNQPEFEVLHKIYLKSKNAYAKSKNLEALKHKAYTEAGQLGQLQIDRILLLKTEFQKAKYKKKYHKVDFKYAKFQLTRWLENHFSKPENKENTEDFIKLVKESREKESKKEKGNQGGKKESREKAPKSKKSGKPAHDKKKNEAKKPKLEKKESAAQKRRSKSTNPPDRDNFKRIEGIGEKIQQLLIGANIFTFKQLAKTSPDQIREILHGGGKRFALADPETWPEQAQMAADGRIKELLAWQKELKGGIKVK